MADVLRSLQVRVGMEASGFQRGIANIRGQINETSRSLDAFSRGAVAPNLSSGIASQVATFDASSQAAFAGIRTRVSGLYGELAKADAALTAAITAGDQKLIASATRKAGIVQRALGQQQVEARGIGLANLGLGDLSASEKAGEAHAKKAFEGIEHGLTLGGARLLGVRLPLRLATSGLGFLGGLVVTEKAIEAVGEATKATEELQKSLAGLRSESGLSVEAVARIGAQALASGVKIDDLATAFKSVRSSGLSFEAAVAQIRSISDASERAAKAQELFGESAGGLTALLAQQGTVTKGTADDIERLIRLQRLQQVGKVIEQKPVPVLAGVGDFFNAFGTNLNQGLREFQAARDAAEELTNANPSASQSEINAARAAAVQKIRDEINATVTLGEKIDENADKQKTFTERIGRLRDAIGGDAQKVLDIGLKLKLSEGQIAAALAPFGIQLNDLSEKSVSAGIRSALEQQYEVAFLSPAVNAQDKLVSLEERRQSIVDQIADTEDRIADRHKQNAEKFAEFSKAELEARLRARDEQRIFIDAAARRSPKEDTAKADARDEREIGKLQKALAGIDAERKKAQADLDKWIASVNAAIGDIVNNDRDVTVNVKLSSDGTVPDFDTSDAADVLEATFDKWLSRRAGNARVVVRNKRPSPFAVAGGSGGRRI